MFQFPSAATAFSGHRPLQQHSGAALSEWQRARLRDGATMAPDRGRLRFPEILADGGLIRTPRVARLEAALLIAEGAVAAVRLAQIARLIDGREVQQLVHLLNEHYDRTRSAFRVEQTAAGFILMTRPSLAPWLDRLHNRPAQLKLSAPMQETLTIIAYQQPVTRADVEAIRGVQSAEMIRHLLDRELIRVAGTDDSLGRPFLYETTRQFLSLFALQRIDDLPDFGTLRRQRPALLHSTVDDNDQSAAA